MQLKYFLLAQGNMFIFGYRYANKVYHAQKALVGAGWSWYSLSAKLTVPPGAHWVTLQSANGQ